MKTINNATINEKYLNKEVIIFGWIQKIRTFGKLTFLDIRDMSGIVQVVLNENKEKLTNESVVEIKGIVVKRKQANFDIPTGQWEIVASKLIILNKATELPFQILDDDNSKEDLRLTYRYLDLRKPKNIAILKTRAKFISAMRQALDKEDFLEIETPILAKSTPEGARDFLVPTRTQHHFFALPQSPQLYKQLLMASGFEKYYQLARVFRDEDNRKDRQPEFTQLDIEIAFQNPLVLQTIIEKILQSSFKSLDIDLQIPFKRLNYDDVIRDYGSDKPDLRFDYKIANFKSFFTNSPFKIISEKENISGLISEHQISKIQFQFLEQTAQKNGAKILFYFNVENGQLKSTNFANKVTNEITSLIQNHKIVNGAVLLVAENSYEKTQQSLGSVRVELNNLFNLANPSQYEFAWIVGWPLYEFDEINNRYGPAHHAFTMYDETTLVNGKIDFVKTRAKAYDLVLNGFEIAGGSQRIFNKKIQNEIFKSIGLNEEQIKNQFGFFVQAFDHGLPPHCGIAFGIDRLIMIITKSESIRDVIAFPKNSRGHDLLSGSPSVVTKVQLDEVFLELNNLKK